MAHKGCSAVGINEVLAEAGVPKGSSYHYSASKDAFGEAMPKICFADCLADTDGILTRSGRAAGKRLTAFRQRWRETQSVEECQGKCLVVKLGAEVAYLSESVRRP